MDQKTTQPTETGSLFSADIFENTTAQPQSISVPVSAPVLTKAEQDIYDSLNTHQKAELSTVIRGMDLTDPKFTTDYGKDARFGIAEINKSTLSVTRTRDLGQAGTSMTNLLLQLKGIEIPSQARGIFKRAHSYIEQFNAKLTSVEDNIEKSITIMQNHQNQLAQDNISLDDLYKKNLGYYKSLAMYVIAGKMKLDEERKTTLMQLKQKAMSTGDMADMEAFKSYESQLDQFDTLLNDFESSKTLCLQTAPMIRMTQETNKLLIQKFDFIFTTAVPAWYIQANLKIHGENSKQAANAANAAIDFTNEIIRENADMLMQTSVEVAKLSHREVIESETLEYANKRLIEGIEAVFKIHSEAQAKMAASRQTKAMLEDDLKNELLRLTTSQ